MPGRLVLLVVWAPWCPPAVDELPHVEQAYQTLHSSGVDVLGLTEGDVKEVRAGLECGIKLGDFSEYLPDDIIECYTLEKVPQQL